jgi:hypothetical protein
MIWNPELFFSVEDTKRRQGSLSSIVRTRRDVKGELVVSARSGTSNSAVSDFGGIGLGLPVL